MKVNDAAIEVRSGILGIVADLLAEVGDGALDVALREVSQAAIDENPGIGRQSIRLAVVGDGAVEIAPAPVGGAAPEIGFERREGGVTPATEADRLAVIGNGAFGIAFGPVHVAEAG